MYRYLTIFVSALNRFWNVCFGLTVGLGVSICPESQSRQKKIRSWRLRKSWQLQKACLDDREVSVKIEKSQFCLEATFQSQKSWSRSRFIKIYQKSWFFLDLNQWFADFTTFLNRDFSICLNFLACTPSKSLNNVEISQ